MLDVAIVILNWNGKEFLKRFLPGVLQNSDVDNKRVEVIVADNASTDGSLLFLNEHFPEVRVIRFEENHGFAKGYDLALNQIEATYYVLLNSDVETPTTWLEPLYTFMENHPEAGVVMPKIKWQKNKNYFEYAGAAGGFIDKYGYTFCQGRIFDTMEKDMGQYEEVREVFWATGACFMIRAGLYRESGGLDHYFFAHMEEIDLCWRVHFLGYKVYYVPYSEVFHVGGGTLPSSNPFKTFLNYRNNLILLYKNLPSNGLYLKIIQRLFLDFISAIHMMFHGNVKGFLTVFKAHLTFYKLIPGLKKQRIKRSYHLRSFRHIIYFRSIVFSYFLRNRKAFTTLDFND